MIIGMYDQVLLKSGHKAFIVEIFESDKDFLADIDRDGDTFTEDVSYDDIQCVLKRNSVN